jgi:SPX domain-containing protein involved in vacuolar polyphosphate accumulation
MTEPIDTFERVEDKYSLTYAQAEQVKKAIAAHVKEDVYYKYTVHSIYYDSIDSQLVIHSLNSTEYRMKLRSRCYTQPEDDTPAFLETKKKLGDIVYKRRFQLSTKELEDYTEYGIPHHVHNNTADEVDYVMKYYNLEPKVLILYERECWAGIQEADVRITFDTNIRYRIDDINLRERGDEKPLTKDTVIMEVKAMDRYPMWLVKVLSEMKLYKRSFSKYGNIYRLNFDAMAPQLNTQLVYDTNEKENTVCSVQY